jgi:hypothetical protein
MMSKRIILLLGLLLSLAAPARGQQGPPADPTPASPQEQPAAGDPSSATTAPAGGALVVDQRERYVLQVSDEVQLTYRYTPEFNFSGRIQPDGFISAPSSATSWSPATPSVRRRRFCSGSRGSGGAIRRCRSS